MGDEMTTTRDWPNGSGGRSAATILYADRQLVVSLSSECAVLLRGEVDVSNSDALSAVLTRAQGGSGEIVVDVANLRFIDLSGLRVLAFASPERQVHLRNIPSHLSRLLRMVAPS
jgi:anti-anti-sigma factor